MRARIVLTTAGSEQQTSKLTKAILEARLAACVTIIPKVTSSYWWDGKIQTDSEELLLVKTQESCLAALQALILREHSYQTPEFVVLKPDLAEERYLQWLIQSTDIKS